ncbi:antiterminator Q family protein [Acinetobacter nosocomialis]|uniref:antiterminator Q family protein n=1 Tax=Acinetobacter nosocomialis TaxID=106654 RepID=UPI000DEF13F9|nr:antiterminator Q family protein [Acinetobacter nosocomialis]
MIMNMAAQQHILQAVNWSKYSFEEWCRQLGAWLNGDTETMVKIVKTMPTKRITQQQREKLMAMYMGDESFKDRLCSRRKGTCCQLNDNEARAIQKIILDMKLIKDEILQEWISAIWSHHVMGNSLRDIAQSNDTSVNQIRQDLKCGMAYIKSRNPHFNFETFEKSA